MSGADANTLKLVNAKLKLAQPADMPAQQALRQEIQNDLIYAGANPALFDFPNGTVVMNAVTGNANSSVFDCGREFFKNAALVRIAATGTTTPTCTYAIQGSMDQTNWSAVQFEDSGTPGTYGNATFTLTPTGTTQTVIKMVAAGQSFKYIRVVTSANTNVTNTVDVQMLS